MQREFETKSIQLKNGISEDTKDLIRNMLKTDSNDRCDAKWILNHPAIAKNREKFRQPIGEEEFTTLIRNYMINTKGTEGRDIPEALSDLMNLRQQSNNKDFFKDVNVNSQSNDYGIARKSSDYRMFYNNQDSSRNNAHNGYAPRGQIFERISNIHKNQDNHNNYTGTHNIYSLDNGNDNNTRFLKSGVANTQGISENLNAKPQLNLNTNNNYTSLSGNNPAKSGFTGQNDAFNYNRTQYQEPKPQLNNSTPFTHQNTERTYQLNNTAHLTSSLVTDNLYTSYGQNNSNYNQTFGSKTANIGQNLHTINTTLNRTPSQFGLTGNLPHLNTHQQSIGNSLYSMVVQNPVTVSTRTIEEPYKQTVTTRYQPSQFNTARHDNELVKHVKVSYELPTSRDSGNKNIISQANGNLVQQNIDPHRANVEKEYSLTSRRYTLENPKPHLQTIDNSIESKINQNKGNLTQNTSSFLPQSCKRLVELMPILGNIRIRRTWRAHRSAAQSAGRGRR